MNVVGTQKFINGTDYVEDKWKNGGNRGKVTEPIILYSDIRNLLCEGKILR